ncbi:DUF3486 family protein [Paenibacillus melissococcoides]|uniref:phage protein Gp27 family protein n=1 Tax=Paenibacillus melissococcoides TaxID=2912268 RepID=UPI0021C43AE6|nr:phage protein Gp27 family protein [Paenibacillus melissococcoides]CAH8721365.1 DUF3486 family protein [Paenibacillus melissococcoides]
MLLDTRYTYWEISEYLEEQGFEVSRAPSVAMRSEFGNATQRLMEAQEQTKALVEMIRKNSGRRLHRRRPTNYGRRS